MFDKNAKQLTASEEFLQLDSKWLERILSRDTLQIDEVELYERTMDWAKETLKKYVSAGAQKQLLINI